MQLLLTSYLFYMYICPCHSLTSSQLTLPPSPCPQVHSLRLRLYSCPAPRFFRTIFFFRFHICVLAYGIWFSLSDLLHSVWQTLTPSTSLQMTPFRFFLIFHCIYVPHLLCPFICQWTLRLFPCLGHCEWCCCEHRGAGIENIIFDLKKSNIISNHLFP